MKSRRGDGWTADDDETMRRMAEANASPLLIAARLKRTASSISRRAAEKGIKLKTLRDQRAIIRRASAEANQ
jgi:hypothetical protein